MTLPRSPSSYLKPIPFKNVSGQTIPAYALMAVTGETIVNGEVFKNCDQTTTTFVREYMVNGPGEVVSITDQNFGIGYRNCDCTFLCDQSSVSNGDSFGPKPSNWAAYKGFPSVFSAQGINDSTNKFADGFFSGSITQLLGKLASPLSQGGSATVDIWCGAGGSEANAGFDAITAYDWLMKVGATAIASGKKVVCELINGVWYVVEAECA